MVVLRHNPEHRRAPVLAGGFAPIAMTLLLGAAASAHGSGPAAPLDASMVLDSWSGQNAEGADPSKRPGDGASTLFIDGSPSSVERAQEWWRTHVGSGPPGGLTQARGVVGCLVTLGQRSSGGYGIDWYVEGNTLVARAREPEGAATMALTKPYAAVLIDGDARVGRQISDCRVSGAQSD